MHARKCTCQQLQICFVVVNYDFPRHIIVFSSARIASSTASLATNKTPITRLEGKEKKEKKENHMNKHRLKACTCWLLCRQKLLFCVKWGFIFFIFVSAASARWLSGVNDSLIANSKGFHRAKIWLLKV